MADAVSVTGIVRIDRMATSLQDVECNDVLFLGSFFDGVKG